uniref:Serine-threonine/tyrosine-protein kinase catalytic domain-containing protein n=1 Tax=Brassica oleracea TaxID=3712 RepID=A0A3P6BEI8_BRAOL|nr:unnamed protein product [Brassica oleracea]
MGLCVSYFSSSPPSKTTNNLSNGADIWSTIETTNSNVGRPNKLLGALSDGSGQILESTNVKLYSFLDLTTATMNFKPDFMLGQGDFGEVYRGWIKQHNYFCLTQKNIIIFATFVSSFSTTFYLFFFQFLFSLFLFSPTEEKRSKPTKDDDSVGLVDVSSVSLGAQGDSSVFSSNWCVFSLDSIFISEATL